MGYESSNPLKCNNKIIFLFVVCKSELPQCVPESYCFMRKTLF